MNKQDFLKALENLAKEAKKRDFDQSIDLIISLKDINLKNPDDQVDTFVSLHYTRGKTMKVAGLVGPEMADAAKKELDTSIESSDFKKFGDKRLIKKLAADHDYIVAQANIMKDVAGTFGRYLGPRGKMPNPKAGCVVPPSANLGQLKTRLQKVVRVQVKKSPSVQVMIGKTSQNTDELVDNAVTVYNAVMHALPQEKNNIKEVYLKYTMSKPVKV